MPSDNVLPMYAVYGSPRDYPGKWVVRRWAVIRGGRRRPVPDLEPLIVADSLENARNAIQAASPGAYCLSAQDGDEPQIVETWL